MHWLQLGALWLICQNCWDSIKVSALLYRTVAYENALYYDLELTSAYNKRNEL